MSAEPYVITVTDNVDAGIKTELEAIGKAAKAAYSELKLVQDAVNSLSASQLKGVNTEMSALKKSVDDLSQGQARLNNTVKEFTPTITAAEKGVRKSNAAMKDAEGATDTLGTSLGALNKIAKVAFLTLAAGFVARSIGQAVLQYDELRGRLASVIPEAEQLKASVAAIGDTASQTGIGIQSLGDFLAQISTRNREYGITADFASKATEALGLAVSLSGKNMADQGKAVEQFGKFLANGTTKTNEFKNLLIQFPAVLTVLKQAFGQDVFGGLASGAITAEQILKTLGGSVEQLRETAQNTPVGIAQAWAMLKETWNAYINDINQMTGASKLLASAILLIRDNLDIVVPLVALFGAAWAVVGISNLVTGIAALATGLIKLATPLAALAVLNPFTAMLVAVTAIILGLAYFTGALDPAIAKLKEVAGSAAKFVKELLGVDPASTEVDGLTAATEGTDTALISGKGSADKFKTSVVTAGRDGAKSVKDISTSAQKVTSDLASATSQAKALASALDKAAAAARRLAAARSEGGGSSSGKQFGGSFMAGKPNIPRYAQGGSFMVGGENGTDRNLVSFMASGNERVTVETPAQRREADKERGGARGGDTNITIIIPGVTNADSFRRSAGQIQSDLAEGVMAGLRH